MTDINYDDFWEPNLCTDGKPHNYIEKYSELWDDNKARWTAISAVCSKCDSKITTNIQGCMLARDKQHSWKETRVPDLKGVIIYRKECLICKTSIQYPITT